MEPEPDPSVWEQRLAQAAPLPTLHPSVLARVVLPMLQWLEGALGSGVVRRRPLLALNGPVGAGKTSIGLVLERLATLAGLRLVVASIDDLYLPSRQRRALLAGNPFGVSRVPPGSHDIPLLLELLADWRAGGELRLPWFDKTLAGGEGERDGWRQQPAEALVIEGWLMGCEALGSELLTRRLQEGRGLEALSQPELDWLPRWDRALEAYAPLWQACDGLWLLRPERWSLPRRWRFQAEARQRRAGGGWLNGAQLEALVRSSLHSLPPALYQDPLLDRVVDQSKNFAQPGGPPWGPAVVGAVLLDGRRRCRSLGDQLSEPSSVSSEIG